MTATSTESVSPLRLPPQQSGELLPASPRAEPGRPLLVDPGTTELRRLLVGRAVRTVFQPIVDLQSGETVGYEALSRGPAGGCLERPDLMFAAALREGHTAELDELCRENALSQALAGGLTSPLALFVNVEPGALDVDRLSRPGGALARAQQQLRVVVEVTERALTARPAELLAVVRRVRELGWAVALDDVGADPRSLALMPFLAPEVIKLDLALVQKQPGVAAAEIVAAVAAEAERSGSLVLAEGIETEEHAELARGMGARLGQGWLLGRPGPLVLPARPDGPLVLPRRTTPPRDRESVFDLAAGAKAVQRVTKPLLVSVSKHLEQQALSLGNLAVVLGAFEHERYFTPQTRERYERLGASASFVGALGHGLSTHPAPGVRGAHLPADDPVIGEWNIAVLGPHFAAALVARDLGDRTGADADQAAGAATAENERRFDYILTYDRELVTAVASAMMSRMVRDHESARVPVGIDWDRLQETTSAEVALSAPPQLAGLDLHLGVLLGAVASTSTGIVIADAQQSDMPLIYVNPAFERLSGYSAAEVLGLNCRFLQGSGTDPIVVEQMRRKLRAGEPVTSTVINYRKDGTPWANECVLSPVHDQDGRLTHYVGVQQDLTDQLAAQQRITHLAHHDDLTGLANRAALTLALEQRVAAGQPTALLFVDLNGFKAVNDVHGHVVGDEVLVEVARRLQGSVRPQDLVARHGGDEFLVLLALDEPGQAGAAREAGQRAAAAVAGPLPTSAGELGLSMSVGVSLFPEDAADVDELLDHADEAMYAAKDGRRGVAVFGDPEPLGWFGRLLVRQGKARPEQVSETAAGESAA